MKQNEDKQFNFHQDTNLKIIFNDGSESKNFKVSVDYHGNLGTGNTIYYFKPAYQPIHMMVSDIVLASDNKVENIQEIEINGQKVDFYHMVVPTQMESPADYQKKEHFDLTEKLSWYIIDQDMFNEAKLGDVDLNGCISYIPID